MVSERIEAHIKKSKGHFVRKGHQVLISQILSTMTIKALKEDLGHKSSASYELLEKLARGEYSYMNHTQRAAIKAMRVIAAIEREKNQSASVAN